MRYPPYPAYKPSGIAWLGNVPELWEVSQLKHALSALISGGTPDTGRPEYWADDGEEGTPWVSIADMTRAASITATERLVTAAGAASKRLPTLPPGTLLYSIYASLGKVATLDVAALFNQAILALIPRPQIVDRRFLAFWMTMLEQHIEQFASSNTQDNLNAAKVRAMPAFLPPLEDQEIIAAFLDRETVKIDTLIAKKRELIEKLNEKRSALISQVVTRGLPPEAARAAGLDPHPRLKPSGIEWLGDIPEHWETSKIKYVARVESGHTPSRTVEDYWIDCTIPWVSLNDSGQLRHVDYISDTAYEINELGLANSSARLLPERAVVFSRDATVGLCAITTKPMAVSQHFVAYICGDLLLPEYLLLTLKAMAQHLERLSLGATIPTVGMDDVRTLECLLPPVCEQHAMVEHLQGRMAHLNRLEEAINLEVHRLIEYRSALITAAVTGRIDVRGAVA